MKELTKEDIKQEVFDLYDEYAHSLINRRQFVDRLSRYAIGGLTVPALMNFIMPNYQDNVKVKADDKRLDSSFITYNSPNGGGEIKALLSKPKKHNGKLPGIVVIHENRGLNPYIEDVGRRAALEGFISIAPDALSPLGGYPGNDDEGRTLQRQRDRGEMLEDFIAAFNHLKNHSDCNGKIGAVGFCFGGWIVNMMAVKLPDLGAGVPFYGRQPKAEDVSKIKAPLMLQFGELDKRVNEGWPAYEAALKENGVDYTAHFYQNANHGFHNNTTPRYDEEAASLAWNRTISFFKEKLK